VLHPHADKHTKITPSQAAAANTDNTAKFFSPQQDASAGHEGYSTSQGYMNQAKVI
jgi:hypothetical protein